jgi:hypothetical protein
MIYSRLFLFIMFVAAGLLWAAVFVTFASDECFWAAIDGPINAHYSECAMKNGW